MKLMESAGMKLIAEGWYELSTGKKVYAGFGVIGISPDNTIYEGFDSRLHDHQKELTNAEIIELAEYMQERWKEVADARR
jgi:hypothetical protein